MKKLDEVRVGSDDLNLSRSQKRVMFKISNSSDPASAIDQIIGSEDRTNLIASLKTLEKYGYVTLTPSSPSRNDEITKAELTDDGNAMIGKHGIDTDKTLLTPDEQKESEGVVTDDIDKTKFPMLKEFNESD